MNTEELAQRLRPFLDAGLLTRIPTRFQIRQGEAAMVPYVISSDATDEARYTRTLFGRPLARRLVIVSMVGRDHLDPGCSIGPRFASIATHTPHPPPGHAGLRHATPAHAPRPTPARPQGR